MYYNTGNVRDRHLSLPLHANSSHPQLSSRRCWGRHTLLHQTRLLKDERNAGNVSDNYIAYNGFGSFDRVVDFISVNNDNNYKHVTVRNAV